MASTNEVDFVGPGISRADQDLFGIHNPQEIASHWCMAHVMHAAGIFPSVTAARKNGWNKPIPAGIWSEFIGKRKVLVTLLNKTADGLQIASRTRKGITT
tara:strand:+ start:227 stop:526 length:300 start_codon:yes stop_codon:yes gene_type:complete